MFTINLFDSLITDYSGIYLKLLLDFEVSLAFVFSDIEEYIKKRGIILPKDFLFPGSYINNKDDLIFYLENLDKYDKDRYSSSRKNLHSIFYSSDIYDNLEICLSENDRNWSKCQIPLQKFKLCYDQCMKQHNKME